MIALLDYGSGNVKSVHKALLKVGAKVRLAKTREELGQCSAIVLPGVGAFDDCMNALARQELSAATGDAIKSGRLFLGICVGYQALFEKSAEFNSSAFGLGIFRGNVVRFGEEHRLKVPQIGWNQLKIVRPECPLYTGIQDGSYVYFVHSYFPRPTDKGIIATETDYGDTFASSVWKDNVFATQFHPEKSQAVGLRLLANFVQLAEGQASVAVPSKVGQKAAVTA